MALITTVVCLALFAGLEAFPQPPQPSCMRACAWCERTVQPLLQEISQRCPLCACAAGNSSCPALRPPTRFCLQGNVKDSRGCDSDRCRPVSGLQTISSMLQDCPKTCPGGFQRNETSALPVCDCVCPLERLPPMERTQQCAQTCRGFTFTTLFNPLSGCTECFCGDRLPVPDCLQFACPLYCPLGYELGPQGCPECRCKEPKNCPAAPNCNSTCLVGPQRDPFTGCVSSCDCADEEEFQCTQVACNKDCGPHKYEPVLKNKCQIACKCTCKEVTCPEEEGRFCVEPELDMYGCPTCECKRHEEPEQNIPICRPPGIEDPVSCDVQCPSGLRPFDSERNCELCDCCSDTFTMCPQLQCETYARNKFGCPLCSCAEKGTGTLSVQLPKSGAQQPLAETDLAQLQKFMPAQNNPPMESLPQGDVQPNPKLPYHPMKPEVPPELFEDDSNSSPIENLNVKSSQQKEQFSNLKEIQLPSEIDQPPAPQQIIDQMPPKLEDSNFIKPITEEKPNMQDVNIKQMPIQPKLEPIPPKSEEPSIQELPSDDLPTNNIQDTLISKPLSNSEERMVIEQLHSKNLLPKSEEPIINEKFIPVSEPSLQDPQDQLLLSKLKAEDQSHKLNLLQNLQEKIFQDKRK